MTFLPLPTMYRVFLMWTTKPSLLLEDNKNRLKTQKKYRKNTWKIYLLQTRSLEPVPVGGQQLTPICYNPKILAFYS